MQLLSLKNNGVLEYTGIEDSFADELALDIDEDVDKVQLTISYLQSCDLLVVNDENEFFLPYVEKCTGSFSQDEKREQWRIRQQRHREKLKLESVTERDSHVTTSLEIEKEIEIEKDININKGEKSKRFIPPTVEEVKAYVAEKGYHVDAENFIDFYESKGWYVGKNKMKDWKRALNTWERRDKESGRPQRSNIICNEEYRDTLRREQVGIL